MTGVRAPALWVRLWLYAAGLATGAAFCVLFTGEVSRDYGARFDPSSLAALSGYSVFWVMLGAAACALLVGSAGRVRFVLVLPAAALYSLLAAYGPPPLGPDGWEVLLREIRTDLYAAANTMYAEPVPYDLSPGVLFAIVPMAMVVVAFAASATLYEGAPVVSVAVLGLTIGVLSTVSFEDGVGPFFAAFLVGAVGLLLSSAGVGRGLLPVGIAAGAAVAVLVLLLPRAPLAEYTISPGAIDWTRIGAGDTSRLGVQADVGDYLTTGREAELLRIRSEEPLFWRGGTLDHFDGVRWSSTVRPGEDDGYEVAPGVQTRLVVQSVQVLNARTELVFGGYRIVKTSLPDGYVEQLPDGSWVASEPFEEGDYYRVLSAVPQPTAAQLATAGTDYPPYVREKFLQLPEDTPGVVGETAGRIQRRYAPSNPYETARAVERYLLYDGGFVYNLDVSYRRADRAIEEFLGEGREGFCTQFATSMALILREMGIPSRVVYGATTGERVGEDEYVVTGSNMHTWVEVFFPGVGWYPFDPTPGFGLPRVMEANAPRAPVSGAAASPIPENPALRPGDLPERPRTPEAPIPERPTRGEQPGAAPAGEGGLPLWPFSVAAALSLIALPPLAKRALVARGRPADLYRDLSGRLRDALPPGRSSLADSPALTVGERLALLSGALGLDGRPFEEFARAYSEHLYGVGVSRRRLSGAYRRALREYGRLPGWRRALAALNPASLLLRARRRSGEGWAALVKRLRRIPGRIR
ncbi:transglutaminaseTgpA domain-containing protein [Rubrobacter xylanophilus]|uniref:transglutaminase family protein n=1 Tax=Rubrobacter xylanophilus TaxID=49319 RepID=UPI00117B5760|nr:transglutaminase domain-containing protein [Rubrobacter xylanophilus]